MCKANINESVYVQHVEALWKCFDLVPKFVFSDGVCGCCALLPSVTCFHFHAFPS